MHLEPPSSRIASFKDFVKHYLMIVLSILTALGLEAWIERTHHAHAADTASTQIEAEIRTNLTETRTVLRKDSMQLKRLDAIRDAVDADLKAHVPADTIKQHILTLTKNDFDLNLDFPALRHEAWDVCVANQSVGWIEHGRAQRYFVAYASQRDFTTTVTENTALLMNGTGLVDTITDLQIGEVQPRAFLHVLSQMIAIQNQTVYSLGRLEQQLNDALPNGTPSARTPMSAS